MAAYKLLPVAGEWVLSKNGGHEIGRYQKKEEAFQAALHLAHEEGASLILDRQPSPLPSPERGSA